MARFDGGFPSGIGIEQAMLDAARCEALGLRPERYGQFLISGKNPLLGTTLADVQTQGGIAVPPLAAAPVSLASSDVGDNFAGAGARVVLVRGVGAGFVGGPSIWQDELVVMTGTTPVLTLQAYLHVVYLRVVVAGAHLGNLGNIDATIGTLQTRIGFDTLSTRGTGVSSGSSYVVPLGWTAHITKLHSSWSENQPATVWFTGALGGVESSGVIDDISSSDVIPVGVLPLPPGLRIVARARRLSGGPAPFGITAPVLMVRIGA